MHRSARHVVARAFAAFALTACSTPSSGWDATPSDIVDVTDASDAVRASDADASTDAADVSIDVTSGVGAACGDAGCAAMQTCASDPPFVNGYCTIACSAASACPADAVCVPSPTGVTLGDHVCALRCATDDDCRLHDRELCLPTGDGSTRACLPAPSVPIGLRDGGPCYTTASSTYQLPALQRATFVSPNLWVSGTASASPISAAEGNLVENPLTGRLAITFIGIDSAGYIGSSAIDPSGSVTPTGHIDSPDTRGITDPVLAYTHDGVLHVLYMLFQGVGTLDGDTQMEVADSMDDGATWGASRTINPPGSCAGGCDKPWIVAGPAPGGSGENVYVAYVGVQGLVIQRSGDGAQTWSDPQVVTPNRIGTGSWFVGPELTTLAVDARGVLHTAYLSGRISTDVEFTLPGNRVVYRSSSDGGVHWSAEVDVAAMNATPVLSQPPLAIDGATIAIGYLDGDAFGAWDFMLSTSTDAGASWHVRKVNDEPDRCATHFLPWLTVDPAHGAVHATFYDNRFGVGEIVYAMCWEDPSLPCEPNELVSDASFRLTTDRNPLVWHGDYRTMLLSQSGSLVAAWSDGRSGGPQMYIAQGTPH